MATRRPDGLAHVALVQDTAEHTEQDEGDQGGGDVDQDRTVRWRAVWWRGRRRGRRAGKTWGVVRSIVRRRWRRSITWWAVFVVTSELKLIDSWVVQTLSRLGIGFSRANFVLVLLLRLDVRLRHIIERLVVFMTLGAGLALVAVRTFWLVKMLGAFTVRVALGHGRRTGVDEVV